jgi:hypothetical protein
MIITVDRENLPGGTAALATSQSQMLEAAAIVDSNDVSYVPPGVNAKVRTVQDKLRDTVSVTDFMTAAEIADVNSLNPVLNVSAAVQNAVDFCIANKKDLIVDGFCRLASSVNINRQVDGAEFDCYFTIASNSGGGFYVDTGIPMFSTTLPYGGTEPVSQLVKFQNIRFEAADAALNAFVLDGNKFLRMSFVSCSFRKIRCANASSYFQSYSFVNCNARRWANTFFSTTTISYDVHFDAGCILEAGQSAIALGLPVACTITNSVIEGMSGYAITYNFARGLTVSGMYFEDNALGDVVDISDAVGGAYSENVVLFGNYHDAPSYTRYAVVWKNCQQGRSFGSVINRGGVGHSLISTSHVEIEDRALLSDVANFRTVKYFRDNKADPGGVSSAYGGGIRGYSVAGQGGKLALGPLNNNVWTEGVVINELGQLGVGLNEPAKDIHVHGDGEGAYAFLSDTVLGKTYGGFIRGFGVAGHGGYLDLGTTQNGLFNHQIRVNHLGGVVPRTDGDQPFGAPDQRWGAGFFTQLHPGPGGPLWSSGAGSPEGAVSASVGSLWTRTDGAANATLYVKESGTGTTGWVAK